MKTRPEDRYASCRDLGDDLEHWLADQPVSAYSEPLPGVVIRWGRRHKPLVGSIGALFFMSVVGLGLHDWRLGQEKGRVETALEQVRQEHIATGQARDEAARHLETTRKALRRQFNLAATSLATFPKTEGLRENLARELLDSYRPLLKTYPDDPNLVFEAGESYRILGTICRRTGKGDEALSLYQTSLKLFESILDHPARKFPARRGLANVLMDLGELHQANGSRSLAEQEHRRASEQVLKLDDDPIRAYYLKYKSSSLITLSGLVRERGAFEESRTLADQAVKLLEKPLEKPPPWWRDQDRWLLALAVYQRGLALRDLKNGASAHNDFDRAQLVARAIPVDSPFYTDAQYAIAMVLVSAAEKPAKPGLQATDMAALLDQAIPMLQNLVRDAAEMPHFREGLCHAFAERCQIMIALNRDNEAAKDCAHALVLANELHQFMPDNPGYLSLLGRATALEGRVAKLRVETGLAQRRLTESVGLLKQALQRDPDRYFDRVRLEALETELVAPARSAPKDQGALP
jgi:tetratricopeptide (TPR) repeat protein